MGFAMKNIRTIVIVSLTSFFLASCASSPAVNKYLCLPEYNLRTLDHDPTLVAKNIPVVSDSATYAGEVGDTVIQRTLFGNFAGGKASFSAATGVPYPQALALVGGVAEEGVRALMSAEDADTLTTNGCRKKSLFSAGKAQAQSFTHHNLLQAATRWAEAMETNESRSNTLLVGFKPNTYAYLAKDHEVAKLWLLQEAQVLNQREDLTTRRRHKVVGLWDYLDPSSIDLVVVEEQKKLNDEWVFNRYFLTVASRKIQITPTGKIVSKIWPDSSDFFDQRLIYNGISGNTVKFLYREFTDTMNRSSFEQEVTYDLNLGEIIGFKGSRFIIHSATNTGIEYSIIKPFNEDGVYRAAEGQPR